VERVSSASRADTQIWRIVLVSIVLEAALFWGLPTLKGEHSIAVAGFGPFWWVGGILAALGLRMVVIELATLGHAARPQALVRVRRLARLSRRGAAVLAGLIAAIILTGLALILIFAGGRHGPFVPQPAPSGLALTINPSRVEAHGTMVWTVTWERSSVQSTAPKQLVAEVRAQPGAAWQAFALMSFRQGRYTLEYRFRTIARPTAFTFRAFFTGDDSRHISAVVSNEVEVLVASSQCKPGTSVPRARRCRRSCRTGRPCKAAASIATL
jgi:hypothetical protein